MNNINILNSLSKEEFNIIQQNRIPTLIKNGLKYFPKLQKWNIHYIIDNYGDSSCNYSHYTRPVRNYTTTTYKNFFNNNYTNSYTFTRTPFNINDSNTFIQDISFPNPLFKKTDISYLLFLQD